MYPDICLDAMKWIWVKFQVVLLNSISPLSGATHILAVGGGGAPALGLGEYTIWKDLIGLYWHRETEWGPLNFYICFLSFSPAPVFSELLVNGELQTKIKNDIQATCLFLTYVWRITNFLIKC